MQSMAKNIFFLGTVVLVGVALAMVNLNEPQSSDLSAVARAMEQGTVQKIIVRGNDVEASSRTAKPS